jgi:hypothetical protein
MRGATYFLRDCPTCGRKLQIRVEYLGKRVACRHCHAAFEALDPLMAPKKKSDSDIILERAEQLLALDGSSVILRDGDFK